MPEAIKRRIFLRRNATQGLSSSPIRLAPDKFYAARKRYGNNMKNVLNLRELGGISTRDGMVVRRSRLFRAGNPGFAAPSDMVKFRGLGLEEIIDLRAEHEKSAEGEAGFNRDFPRKAVPVVAGDLRGLEMTIERTEAIMLEMYRDFATVYREQFATVLRQAEAGKTFMYHCTAGKDRTGFASFLLLNALGADEETVMEDYLLSNRISEALAVQVGPLFNSWGISLDDVRPLLSVAPHYLEESYNVIRREFGGMDNYLRHILKIDVERIRSHYLERPV